MMIPVVQLNVEFHSLSVKTIALEVKCQSYEKILIGKCVSVNFPVVVGGAALLFSTTPVTLLTSTVSTVLGFLGIGRFHTQL